MSDRKLANAQASLHCEFRRYVQNTQSGDHTSAILYCRAHRVGAGLQITYMALSQRMNFLSN